MVRLYVWVTGIAGPAVTAVIYAVTGYAWLSITSGVIVSIGASFLAGEVFTTMQKTRRR